MKIQFLLKCSPSGHPRCKWVCFFIVQQIWRNLSMHYISCSPVDPLQCMGAFRMRVQTADKNITVVHKTPVHHLTSCKVKSCMFVRKKSIKMLLMSNKSFILFSPLKKLSHLNRERNMHRSNTIYKWKQSKTALNKYFGGFRCERTAENGLFSWRKRYYGS